MDQVERYLLLPPRTPLPSPRKSYGVERLDQATCREMADLSK